MARPRAVIFDFFGTLTADQSSTERHRVQEPVAAALGVGHGEFVRALRASFDDRASGRFGDASDSLRTVARTLGAEPSDEALRLAVSLREAGERQLTVPRAGMLELLSELHGGGVPIGLLSDCTHELVSIWPELPFARYVTAAVFSVEVGVRKPDPEMYDQVTRELGVRATEVVYVGDGGSNELTGAQCVGMRPVLLRESLDEDASITELRYDAELDWAGEHVRDAAELRELLIGSGLLGRRR